MLLLELLVRDIQGLVMTQIAMTVVLLCVSGPLAQSFRELMRSDTGVDPRAVLTINVGLDGEPYDSRQQQYVTFYQQAFERFGNLPGVRSVSASERIPVTSVSPLTSFHIEGEPRPAAADQSSANRRM